MLKKTRRPEDKSHRRSGSLRWLLAVSVLAGTAVAVLLVAAQRPVALAAPADQPQARADAPASETTVATARRAATGVWPLFRGDPQSTGATSTSLPSPLRVLWKYEVPGGAFEGAAALDGDTAYLADLDGTVYALNLNTGKLRWKFETESGFNAAPAVSKGLLYVGDYDGRFICLDAKTGKLKWDFDTGMGAEINSSANFHGNNVLVGSQDATLYCLNAATGAVVWKHAIADQIRCTPTIAGDRAFVAGCDGQLHVIDVLKGAEVAAVDIESPTGVTPAAAGDFVYFGTHGGVFFSVDWKQAKVAWAFEDEDSSNGYRSSAAVAQGIVVVGTQARRVLALDAKTGKPKWTFPTRQRVESSPVVAGDRVYVGSVDGRLYGLELKSGKKVWEYDSGAGFFASPAVAGGRLIIANEDGVVYCFGSDSTKT